MRISDWSSDVCSSDLTVDYQRDQVVQIEGAPGYQVLIALAPDERVQNVALGDSGAWQVVTSQSGNMLFVRPTQDGVSTNMTVITSARFYAFDLVSANGAPPYEVRFRYPAELENAPQALAGMGEAVGRYKLSGTKALWPASMADDGVRTYIDWPANKIGRAHVWTPVTNAHLVCRLLLEK